jgi:hypothetical protein
MAALRAAPLATSEHLGGCQWLSRPRTGLPGALAGARVARTANPLPHFAHKMRTLKTDHHDAVMLPRAYCVLHDVCEGLGACFKDGDGSGKDQRRRDAAVPGPRGRGVRRGVDHRQSYGEACRRCPIPARRRSEAREGTASRGHGAVACAALGTMPMPALHAAKHHDA